MSSETNGGPDADRKSASVDRGGFRVTRFVDENFAFLNGGDTETDIRDGKAEEDGCTDCQNESSGEDLRSDVVHVVASKDSVAQENLRNRRRISDRSRWEVSRTTVRRRTVCDSCPSAAEPEGEKRADGVKLPNGVSRHQTSLGPSQLPGHTQLQGRRCSVPAPVRSPIPQEKGFGGGESDSAGGGNSPFALRRNLDVVRRSLSPGSRSLGSGSESARSHGSEDSDDDDDAGIYAESLYYSGYKFIGDNYVDCWLSSSKSDTWLSSGQLHGDNCAPAAQASKTALDKTEPSDENPEPAVDSQSMPPNNSHCGCIASPLEGCEKVTVDDSKSDMSGGSGACWTSSNNAGEQPHAEFTAGSLDRAQTKRDAGMHRCGSSDGSEALGFPSLPSVTSTSVASMSESDLDVSGDSGFCMEGCATECRHGNNDAVFLHPHQRQQQQRSVSLSTAHTERQFREHRFQSAPERKQYPVVRRYERSSSTAYTRVSRRIQEVDVIELEKSSPDDTYGFHIIGSEVTTVEVNSVACTSGVKAGSILVTVNDIEVTNASHEEIQELIRQDPLRVTLGFSANSTHTRSCRGYLTKQGGSGPFKNWRRRWFELKEDNCLYYYKDKTEKDPLGAILLINYTLTRAPEVNRKHTFKIVKYGQRDYFFQADSEEDMNRWAQNIALAAAAANKKNETWLGISSHNVGLPALSIKSPDCHGYLTKMGNRIKSWHRRYCVLKDACLYYYREQCSSTAQGVAHLHGYRVQDGQPQNKKLGFMLVPPEPDMRTFHFVSDHETDKKRWMEAFEKSIAKWVKTDE